MKNKSFINILAIMFILFVAVFDSTGCIDTNHDKMLDNPNPNPTPEGPVTVTFDSNGSSNNAR